jgi:hypothetical protein
MEFLGIFFGSPIEINIWKRNSTEKKRHRNKYMEEKDNRTDRNSGRMH